MMMRLVFGRRFETVGAKRLGRVMQLMATAVEGSPRARTTQARRRQVTHALEALEARWLPTLMISLQEAGVNGGVPTVVGTAPDFTGVSYSGTYGDFWIRGFGGASDNGILGGTLSDLQSSATSVTNIGSNTATLYLTAYQGNYTLPAASTLIVEGGLGGSMNAGTQLGLANIFQTNASPANNPTHIYTSGPQSAVPNGNSFTTGSASGSFSPAGSPYSLWSTVAINLNPGGTVNFADHVKTTPATTASAVASSSLNNTTNVVGIMPIEQQPTKTVNHATHTIGPNGPLSS
jgi:hypothetical protein